MFPVIPQGRSNAAETLLKGRIATLELELDQPKLNPAPIVSMSLSHKSSHNVSGEIFSQGEKALTSLSRELSQDLENALRVRCEMGLKIVTKLLDSFNAVWVRSSKTLSSERMTVPPHRSLVNGITTYVYRSSVLNTAAFLESISSVVISAESSRVFKASVR